ncbi:MAG: DUF502 domain-containing protein [Pseudomonadota bacterium]
MSKSEPDDGRHIMIKPARRTLLQRLRTNFLTGIVVSAPISITAYLTWTIINYIDDQVLPQVAPLIPEAYRHENLLFSIPGFGLVVCFIALVFVGSLARNFLGREILRISERWVDRMPVVRSIYNGLKQIAETIFADSARSFQKACLVEYPRKGIWAVAFISTETRGEVPDKALDGREMMSVFLPTTPNPTSGFLLFVPKEDVIILDMTVEEAAKLVISAGLVLPPEERGPAAATAAARGRRGGGAGAVAGSAGAATGAAPAAAPEPQRAFSARVLSRRRRGEADPATAGENAARNPIGTVYDG